MSSLNLKDRVSLCRFTFADGRRCRTPRISTSPDFCHYHAEKVAHSRAAESLAKDLASFFSGDYLSACDLSTALARLIPAAVRGDIKPKLARTIAYMCQTLLQSIHASQHEYIDAYGTEGWRKAVRSSVTANYDLRFPATSNVPSNVAPGFSPASANSKAATGFSPASASSNATTGQNSAPSPLRPASPPAQPHQPSIPTPSTPAPPQSRRSRPLPHSQSQRSSPVPPAITSQPTPSRTQPRAITHSSRRNSPPPHSAPPKPCHPERSEGSRTAPAPPTVPDTRPSSPSANSAQPNTPLTPAPQPLQPLPSAPHRDPYAVHFDHNHRLLTDGKPW